MIEIAIVGLGSWGLCVLERAVRRVRQTGASLRVHVIEPGPLGGGVYSTAQPDYLVLNNACGQLSLYASPDGGVDPPYAVGLHQWAVSRGYRWVGHRCVVGGEGRPVEPGDYLPRRLMGEYLAWFYETLVADAPPNLEIVRHYAAAIDIFPQLRGREAVMLADGKCLTVDHVVLTSGHTLNTEPPSDGTGVRYLRPYPVEYFDQQFAAGAPIAVAGLGLVAFDLMAAMTIGRGGEFEDVGGDRLHYVRSGREPVVYLYSRSGVPYCAKSAQGLDPYGDYEPVVCTPEAFAELTNPGGSRVRRAVDFREDLLPLILAEMQARYHTHAAFRAGGAQHSAALRKHLRDAWLDGQYEEAIKSLEACHGAFDPAAHVFAGTGRRFRSSQDYQAQVYEMVELDLDEALMDGGSPVKAAQEVTRILRDHLRSVIEFGGLSLESYIDFQSNVRGRINRLEAGPPPIRSQQLLALMEAGVVRIPFGPSPEVTGMPDGRVAIRSTQLDRLYASTVNGVVRGHLDLPSLARTASPLLKRLYANGRLTQLTYGDTAVGSVAISDNFHPFDSEGRVQTHVSVLGVLTEGVRYFTHYLPSPRSRLRAVVDAQTCVDGIIA